MKSDHKPIGLEFPCQFPIKVMGEAKDGFLAHVINLVKPHVAQLDTSTIEQRYSKKGRYLSMTIIIEAQSREQLDSIYLDLTQDKKSLMVL